MKNREEKLVHGEIGGRMKVEQMRNIKLSYSFLCIEPGWTSIRIDQLQEQRRSNRPPKILP